MSDGLKDFLNKAAKRCPKCNSAQLTTTNNRKPLKHRCLDCGHRFKDAEARRP